MKKTTRKYRIISVLIIVLFLSIGCWEGIDELLEKGEDLSDRTVSIATIEGVTPPAYKEMPVTEIIETAQYTGIINWSPDDSSFAAETVYTATITLTAKPGYTFTGVAANFFKVAGADSVTNAADSGVVTAVFPKTFFSIGDQEIYSADGVSFKMAYVPGGLTFPTGIDDSGIATVDNDYWIAETQVTYELWKKVYDWAVTNGYTFANVGQMGSHGEGVDGMTNQHPVTKMNWRDSVVWCNALTEWYNAHKGTDYECVYTYSGDIIRDSSNANATVCDGAVPSTTAKGFRLLTCNEWELAARYRGSDTTNVVIGIIDSVDFDAMEIKWTKGGSASGGTAPRTETNSIDYSHFSPFAWYGNNITEPDGNTTTTQPVGLKTCNALGLYDMSGNVWDWCFTASGTFRVKRGGGWLGGTYYLQIGRWHCSTPSTEYYNDGFRFGRSQ